MLVHSHDKPPGAETEKLKWVASHSRAAAMAAEPSTLALVKQVDGFQNRIAYDFQAFGAQLVHGVLRGVMEYVVVSVIEVDVVGAGDATFNEGQVIVFDGALAGVEVGLVA